MLTLDNSKEYDAEEVKMARLSDFPSFLLSAYRFEERSFR